ncbi:MAG: hypothetical protein Q9182_000013 [Xanthomendoza sp. 2 TL-2023]
MSIESSHLQRAGSPALSGRSSPVNPRIRAEEDGSSKTDKATRRYAAGIDRALSLFDTALQEWADYLPFLGRLLKALQLHPPGTSEIPHKALVAQRLSQCLNPALPAGVHQEALKVYTYIFSLIGKDGLGRDLSFYLPGLSPVLAYASLLIKPSLLSLFDTFIAALDPVDLRPALKGILLSLLPGLEEESGEELERTHDILQRLRTTIAGGPHGNEDVQITSGDHFFWQCLFLVAITSTSRRQGVLAYLQRHLPRLGKATTSPKPVDEGPVEHKPQLSPGIAAVTSPEPGLLIRCFIAGLSDDQLLVQRGYLDLLVTHLPLDSEVLLRKVPPEDHVRLVTAAASVVARREMSLNRRLWTWFLGPDEPSTGKKGAAATSGIGGGRDSAQGQRVKYFRGYGLNLLVQGILNMLGNNAATPVEKARPFRISLALMDQWEIGGFVVPKIFLPALKSVWRYQRAAPTSEAFDEVLRSAIVFFDGVESRLIWDEISNKLLQATDMEKPDPEVYQQSLELAHFVIKHFNLQEEEMLTRHIPLLVLSLLLKSKSLTGSRKGRPEERLVDQMLDLIGKLLDMIPRRAFGSQDSKPTSLSRDTTQNLDLNNKSFLTDMRTYYVNGRENSRLDASRIDNKVIARLITQNIVQVVTHELYSGRGAGRFFEAGISILEKIFRRTSVAHLLNVTEILSSAQLASQVLTSENDFVVQFKDFTNIVFLLETLHVALSSTSWLEDHRLRPILSNILAGLWPYLSPASPKTNVEAVRCVWRLQSLSIDRKLVESCIVALMVKRNQDSEKDDLDVESARRFATLWSQSNSSHGSHARRSSLVPVTPKTATSVTKASNEHILARPLLLILDSLEDRKTAIFTFTSGWLQSSVNVQIILAFLQQKLRAAWLIRDGPSTSAQIIDIDDDLIDLDEYLYYLRTLYNLVEHTPSEMWPTLLSRINDNDVDQEVMNQANYPGSSLIERINQSSGVTNQVSLTKICLKVLQGKGSALGVSSMANLSRLKQTSVSLLQEIVVRSNSLDDIEGEVESPIVATLSAAIEEADHPLQVSSMALVSAWLRRRLSDKTHSMGRTHRRDLSSDHDSHRTSSVERPKEESRELPATPPPALLDCVLKALGSGGSQPVLYHWIQFLDFCLPYYNSIIIQILMPLVERFAKTVGSLFDDLRSSFQQKDVQNTSAQAPINTIIELLNGTEQLLGHAHNRLTEDESTQNSTKTPEQVQGFFGNMVSGVFASEGHKSRPMTANNRLTVILCFKDAVKLCLRIWSWGADSSESSSHNPVLTGSFNYTSLRLRNRARRVLEHLFAAESLECLETLVEAWYRSKPLKKSDLTPAVVLNLLHVLDGSRPRNTIPAIFNALYSRTNPNALDPDRKSTLASELVDTDLARFLVEYTRSLEDDAMDEIWSDCMAFLKDILSNPLPHRQSLPKLLEFTALLGTKIDNTNFGENRKRRRELSDLFLRQLTATFTIKPLSFNVEFPPARNQKLPDDHSQPNRMPSVLADDHIVSVLAAILPNVSKILVDSDRITAASSTISAQVIVPTLRSKSFPQNVTLKFLDLLLSLTQVHEASKTWRRDIADAFVDPRLFCHHSHELVDSGWLPLIRQWIVLDKDRMDDFVSRLPSPTSAGIMFGVGASSARLEADRKAQLNLRRVATLLLAATGDGFVEKIGTIQEKIADLLTATSASSPSSAIRPEIYMVLRALVLKVLPVHLALFWPLITKELQEAISSLFPGRSQDKYNIHCVVHACKLLDVLVLIAPEDFQMRQWLFITDTIDAVYRPQGLEPRALIDELAEDLDASAGTSQSVTISAPGAQIGGRKPLLTTEILESIPTEELVSRALRPFLRQLSINAFESTYSMRGFDWQACYEDLLLDLFDEKSLV